VTNNGNGCIVHKKQDTAPATRETRRGTLGTTERTDEQLMDQLRQGDQNALATLVMRYQNDLLRFCTHYLKNYELARETAQETFIRVYVARDRFDASRRFKPWVLCIARNLCLNELKRKKAFPMESLEEYASTSRQEDGGILPSGADGPDEVLMTAERRRLLVDALNGLDSESREIVQMRFFEKMPARDIAEVVGSTEGAVRTRLHRILKGMRDKYEGMKEDH
jgi:RNA polymerase sigma-70 factor, ECF subfamily